MEDFISRAEAIRAVNEESGDPKAEAALRKVPHFEPKLYQSGDWVGKIELVNALATQLCKVCGTRCVVARFCGQCGAFNIPEL